MISQVNLSAAGSQGQGDAVQQIKPVAVQTPNTPGNSVSLNSHAVKIVPATGMKLPPTRQIINLDKFGNVVTIASSVGNTVSSANTTITNTPRTYGRKANVVVSNSQTPIAPMVLQTAGSQTSNPTDTQLTTAVNANTLLVHCGKPLATQRIVAPKPVTPIKSNASIHVTPNISTTLKNTASSSGLQIISSTNPVVVTPNSINPGFTLKPAGTRLVSPVNARTIVSGSPAVTPQQLTLRPANVKAASVTRLVDAAGGTQVFGRIASQPTSSGNVLRIITDKSPVPSASSANPVSISSVNPVSISTLTPTGIYPLCKD